MCIFKLLSSKCRQLSEPSKCYREGQLAKGIEEKFGTDLPHILSISSPGAAW